MPETHGIVAADLMRHALGLDQAEKPYRNRYAAASSTPVSAAWWRLTKLDLARYCGCQGKLDFFRVTAEGARSLGIDPKLYPEEFPDA